jgi:hypothetical protein
MQILQSVKPSQPKTRSLLVGLRDIERESTAIAGQGLITRLIPKQSIKLGSMKLTFIITVQIILICFATEHCITS